MAVCLFYPCPDLHQKCYRFQITWRTFLTSDWESHPAAKNRTTTTKKRSTIRQKIESYLAKWWSGSEFRMSKLGLEFWLCGLKQIIYPLNSCFLISAIGNKVWKHNWEVQLFNEWMLFESELENQSQEKKGCCPWRYPHTAVYKHLSELLNLWHKPAWLYGMWSIQGPILNMVCLLKLLYLASSVSTWTMFLVLGYQL